ncbi:hypothetical protein B0A48_14295 [Lecanosticta acicola]|uniref:F-box domain-containing protein n=1 Tax=Lecanosticta acicola TaxID=111012 RepID=A0AAI8YYK1_9PEZI|nr:hypothetical protein B0A48_14295 [Lecanosticta acicola]
MEESLLRDEVQPTEQALPCDGLDGPADAARNPAAEVFAIAELLEDILLYLDMFHLFVIQRTCKAFSYTMRDSFRLRRHMWLEAKPSPGGVWTYPRKFNPFLMSALFSPLVHTKKSMDPNSGFSLQDKTRGLLMIHFNFKIHPGLLKGKRTLQGGNPQVPLHVRTIESWQRMVPTQPALDFVAVKLSKPQDFPSWVETETWKALFRDERRRGERFTLGHMYDILEGRYRKYSELMYGRGWKAQGGPVERERKEKAEKKLAGAR